jgi:uncharacterized protein YjbI with pentapeptide repeats/DNA polymerase III epsilon subunit-like protein
MLDGYVFLDTETNGRGSSARVIELALIQTSLSGERQKEFTSLIHGDGYSGGSRLVSIHHITDEMLNDAPHFDQVWLDASPMLQNRIIVAHNSIFDQGMINRELERINESTLGDFLCTLKLARFLGIDYNKTNTREGASGKLGDLVRLFGLNVKPDHRALSDTDALASIFWKMKEIYPNEVNEFIDYHQNVTASHLKQRGSTPISDIPRPVSKKLDKSDEYEIVKDDEINFDVTTEEQNFNRLNLPSADFSNRILDNAQFCQIFADGANFSYSSLDESHFIQANLSDTIFKNASAVKADFNRAGLRNADFTGANLEGADFRFSDLSNADFTGANLEGALFSWANLLGTNFTDANLALAEFHNSFFQGTTFFNAIVECCNLPKGLHNYDFTDIDFTNVRYKKHWELNFPNTNFTRANLRGLDLEFTNFTGANFTNADLTGTNLSDADLSGANFTGANLSQANLSEANLSGSNFTSANLSQANLSDANFFEANFVNAHCYQTTFRISHESFGENHRPDFTGANLVYTDFSDSYHLCAIMAKTNLCNANFRGASLSYTDFSGSELVGADFSMAEMKHVTISASQLAAAKFDWISIDKNTYLSNGFKKTDLNGNGLQNILAEESEDWSDLIDSPSDFTEFFAELDFNFGGDFAGWDFSTANLNGNSLLGSNLRGCDFTASDLSFVNLGDADCAKTTFSQAILVGTSFENANLTQCSFEKATIYDANFTGADLSNAILSKLDLTAMEFGDVNFSNASLVSVDFSNSNLSDSCFIGANLEGTRFVGSDLTNSDFSNANLTNCIFQDAELANVNFAGSNLSGANFLSTQISIQKLRFAKLSKTLMPDGTVSRA